MAFVAVQFDCGVVCVYTRRRKVASSQSLHLASLDINRRMNHRLATARPSLTPPSSPLQPPWSKASLLITLPSAAHALLAAAAVVADSSVNEIIFARRRRRRQRRIFSPCWLGLFAMTAASPHGRQPAMKSGRKLTQLWIRSQGWIKAIAGEDTKYFVGQIL